MKLRSRWAREHIRTRLCNVPVIFVRSNWNQILSKKRHKTNQYQTSWKSVRPVPSFSLVQTEITTLTGAIFSAYHWGGFPKSEKVRLTREILASAHLKMMARLKQMWPDEWYNTRHGLISKGNARADLKLMKLKLQGPSPALAPSKALEMALVICPRYQGFLFNCQK